MAKNMIFGDVPSLRRVVEVGSNVAPGTPVRTAFGPGVTLTGSGDYKPKASTLEGVEYEVRDRGGVGLGDKEATVAFSGSFAFDITHSKPASVKAGDLVVMADASSRELTIAGADSTPDAATVFGVIEFVRSTDADSADVVVRIGAN